MQFYEELLAWKTKYYSRLVWAQHSFIFLQAADVNRVRAHIVSCNAVLCVFFLTTRWQRCCSNTSTLTFQRLKFMGVKWLILRILMSLVTIIIAAGATNWSLGYGLLFMTLDQQFLTLLMSSLNVSLIHFVTQSRQTTAHSGCAYIDTAKWFHLKINATSLFLRKTVCMGQKSILH